jgi:serine/threonine protein kinase
MRTVKPLTLLTEEKKELKDSKALTYQKIKLVGSGNYGNVYFAKSTNNKYFALKTVKKDKHIDVEREMEILQRISNCHIVSYVDSFYDYQNQFNIVMEYVDGFDLNQIISNNINIPEIILPSIIHQVKKKKISLKKILIGLSYLHEHHIIHRDLKPSNVMISLFSHF